ncbi:MAG: hypothetical protein DMG14_23250 [Acidobacteria bacterium]|nr:MAG: hypothetical protein DMG14_23250 [Acidobacteriota bacterium]
MMPDDDAVSPAGVNLLGAAADDGGVIVTIPLSPILSALMDPVLIPMANTSASRGPARCSTSAAKPLGRRPAFKASLIRTDQL